MRAKNKYGVYYSDADPGSISLLLGDRVCFIARILYMRKAGVLKIVKSVSHILKNRSGFYLCHGGAQKKKKNKRKEKMRTINFTFRPGACCPFDFYAHYVLRRGTHTLYIHTRIHTRPLRCDAGWYREHI